MKLYQVRRDTLDGFIGRPNKNKQTFQTVQVRPAMSVFSGKAPFVSMLYYYSQLVELNKDRPGWSDYIFDNHYVLSNAKGFPFLDGGITFGGNYIMGEDLGKWVKLKTINYGDSFPANFSYQNHPWLIRVPTVVRIDAKKILHYSEPAGGRVYVPFVTRGNIYIEKSKVMEWPEGKPLEDPVYGVVPMPMPRFEVVVINRKGTKLMRKPTDRWLASGFRAVYGQRFTALNEFGDWWFVGQGWLSKQDAQRVG